MLPKNVLPDSTDRNGLTSIVAAAQNPQLLKNQVEPLVFCKDTVKGNDVSRFQGVLAQTKCT